MNALSPRLPPLLFLMFAAGAAAVCCGQPNELSPERANQALVAAFEAAWNAHDMVAFGRLLAEDVDWVNVDGYRGQGRQVVEDGHARVHATKFKDSVMTIHGVDVAIIAPNVALLHVTWGLRGDRNNDGTAREPREGIFTWVTVNAGDGWRIRASHNSNKGVIR